MSDSLSLYSLGGELTRPARRASRAITSRQLAAQVRLAGVDADTDVAIGKIENLTMATGVAASAVVRVARAQRYLEQLAPEASERLAFLADDHMIGCADMLADLPCSLRRR
jgi:CO/xanthine dehydrogenase FAD-binding subunit